MSARKKQKLCSSDGNDGRITENVNKKIENNKSQAEIKLQHKATPLMPLDIGMSWFSALKTEFTKEYFMKISKFVANQRDSKTVFPPAADVWTWTRACEISEVKVVILGQDPYHGPNQAHGLSFSVQKGVPVPPSLKNMYKELNDDIEGFKIPSHGHLYGWAAQGVLLLNAVLTVRSGEPNSHKNQGWEQLTDAVIRWLNKNNSNVVFLLWGKDAQKKGSCIDKKKHLVLATVHPSPLSASRGFFGCKHFSKANEYLTKNGRTPIDWTDL